LDLAVAFLSRTKVKKVSVSALARYAKGIVPGAAIAIFCFCSATGSSLSSDLWGDVLWWSTDGDIVTQNFDATNYRIVLHEDGVQYSYPVISPDGQALVMSRREGGNVDACILTTLGMTCIPTPGYLYGFGWSPDSQVIFYSINEGDGQIWSIDLSVEVPVSTLFLDPNVYRTFGVCVTFDGDHLIMAHDPSNWTYNNFIESFQISTNMSSTILPTDGLRDFFPTCSPTRNEIVWGRGTRPSCCGEPLDVWIMNADGTNARALTSDSSVLQHHPRFSPDGDQVFYLETNSVGSNELWVVDRLGGNRMFLLDLGPSARNIDISANFAPVLTVQIDIKPGSDTNSINLGSAGVVPVAILSSAEFDAPARIDPGSISLAGARVKLVGKKGKALCHDEDVNDDGFVDLLCQVETEQFLLEEGETNVTLEAETYDGQTVQGSDLIRIVPDTN